MIFQIDQLVDLAVSGSELGIISLSILNPLLHIIVRELNLGKKRVQFRGTLIESFERNSFESDSENRVTISEYVDEVDEERVIIVDSFNDAAVAVENSIETIEADSKSSLTAAPVTQEFADVNEDLHKLMKRVDELEDILRELSQLQNDSKFDSQVVTEQKERVTWQDVEFKKQEQLSDQLYEKLLAQLRTELCPQVVDVDDLPSFAQNVKKEVEDLELQHYSETADHSIILLPISDSKRLEQNEALVSEQVDTLNTTQDSSDGKDEDRFDRIEKEVTKTKDDLQTLAERLLKVETSEVLKLQQQIALTCLENFEKDIAELSSLIHIVEANLAKLEKCEVTEPQTPFDLSRLEKLEENVAELRSIVLAAKGNDANDALPQLDMARLNTLEQAIAELWSAVHAVEESQRKAENTAAEVQYNVKIEHQHEMNLLEDLRTDFCDLIQADFQTFIDEFERKLNELPAPACPDIDEFGKSLLNLQNDLHKALAEIQKVLDTKVDQCAIADLKQHLLGLLETNTQEIQKRFGLQDVAEAAGTSKWLKGLHCLSCGRTVDQCKIDEKPKKVMKSLMHNWVVEDTPHGRQCGGAHTIILPEERIEKKGNFLEDFGVESLPLAKTTYLAGSDGCYYLAAPAKCEEQNESEP